MLDLLLAIGHHLLIFAIFGIICAEFWGVRAGMSSATRFFQVIQGSVRRNRVHTPSVGTDLRRSGKLNGVM